VDRPPDHRNFRHETCLTTPSETIKFSWILVVSFRSGSLGEISMTTDADWKLPNEVNQTDPHP